MGEKISVIVPVYNVEQYLERCAESIINQTYKNVEIILVDDGSTDNSGKLCDELAKKDERIKVIHKENGGVSEARNIGIDSATGEYVIFIDSDDYINEEMLSELYSQIKKENADVSVCGVMNVYENNHTPQARNINEYLILNNEEFLREYLKGERVPGGIWNKLIKASIAKTIKFPVGRIYEDAYYHYELIKLAKRYVVTTKPLYNYYHREGSLTEGCYKKRDLSCIDIYTKFYDYALNNALSTKEEAFFRLSYSYFVILDKMLLQDDYKKIEDYDEIVGFLKKNAFKIFRNNIFRTGRRIAAITLLINIKLYRMLLFKNIKNSKKVHD